MIKFSRKLFYEAINDEELLKALALLIFVKEKTPTSVIPNFSYYKLAKMTGMHKETIKRRINTLAQYNLVEYVNKYNTHLRFNRIRDERNNVNISKLDKSSVKNIELGLKTIVLVEIQKHKNYVKQQFIKATRPDEKVSLEEHKDAKRFCKKRGITNFNDNGISYSTLAKRIHVGYSKVAEIIEYGMKNGMFLRQKNIKVIYSNIVYGANILLDELRGKGLNVFYSSFTHSIYQCNANSYDLLS